MIRDIVSPTPEAITIDDRENHPRLDHITRFKTLKFLLKDGIKQAMIAQFTALQNMFTQHIDDRMNRKMKTLAGVVVENISRTMDQIREDNTRLRTQITDFTREARSMVAAKATTTCTPQQR